MTESLSRFILVRSRTGSRAGRCSWCFEWLKGHRDALMRLENNVAQRRVSPGRTNSQSEFSEFPNRVFEHAVSGTAELYPSRNPTLPQDPDLACFLLWNHGLSASRQRAG